MTEREILICLAGAAVVALTGLVVIAGIAGLGFGVVLLICGGVGALCADDIADARESK